MVYPENQNLVSKVDTYLNCAEVFAYRSTCLKRKYGAVIVKDDVVISTGYNGSPRGFENCCEVGTCPRIEKNASRRGLRYLPCSTRRNECSSQLFPTADYRC